MRKRKIYYQVKYRIARKRAHLILNHPTCSYCLILVSKGYLAYSKCCTPAFIDINPNNIAIQNKALQRVM